MAAKPISAGWARRLEKYYRYMTDEERQAYREKCNAAYRRRRARMTDAQKEHYRKLDRERKRRARANVCSF